MGIPIGKLQLYTACAAVPPDCLLPILLDTGSPAAEIYAKPVLLYLQRKDLIVSHGFAIHFQTLIPPKEVDVVMVTGRYHCRSSREKRIHHLTEL
jgi:ketol-acid reductoisomerase